MKIYNTEATYQSLGNAILVVLRGHEKDVEETHYGFYNFNGCFSMQRTSKNKETGEIIHRGVNDKSHVDYGTHNKDVGSFYSTMEKVRNFFFWKTYHKNVDDWPRKKRGVKNLGIYPFCHQEADRLMTEFEASREVFFDPNSASKLNGIEHIYGMGQISASRPDEDFKDSVINNAFSNSQSEGRISSKDIDKEEIGD